MLHISRTSWDWIVNWCSNCLWRNAGSSTSPSRRLHNYKHINTITYIATKLSSYWEGCYRTVICCGNGAISKYSIVQWKVYGESFHGWPPLCKYSMDLDVILSTIINIKKSTQLILLYRACSAPWQASRQAQKQAAVWSVLFKGRAVNACMAAVSNAKHPSDVILDNVYLTVLGTKWNPKNVKNAWGTDEVMVQFTVFIVAFIHLSLISS